jgi:hypothetical protein
MEYSNRNKLSRREFLKLSFAASSCIMLASTIPGCQSASGRRSAGQENYYLSHRDEIMKTFRRTNEGAMTYLGAAYGTKDALFITGEAAAEMERLLPGMPEVGGDRNENTPYIIIAGWYAAYYKPMKALLGKTPEDVGKMIYELNRAQYSTMPREQVIAEGNRLFSPDYLKQMRRWAEGTKQKEYPADWVAAFVEGDGKEFDWGYEYTECGVVKYLRSLGLGDLGPYVCLNDFVRSRALNTGLERTTTLAEGYDSCNFRYKWGRPVTRDWSTETPRIRMRIRGGFVRTFS